MNYEWSVTVWVSLEAHNSQIGVVFLKMLLNNSTYLLKFPNHQIFKLLL